MAKTLSKPNKKGTTAPKEVKSKTTFHDFQQRTMAWCADERVRFICGLVLFVFTLYVSLAAISFFTTGKADFSILEQAVSEQNAERGQVTNWTGLPGAYIVNVLFVKWFGLSSFIILFALGVVAFYLMNVKLMSLLKLFFHSVFWLVWSSVAIAFFFQYFYADSFFCWGGEHGRGVSEWLTSYIKIPGVILLVVTTLLVFLVITNKNTIPFLRMLGVKFKQLFVRKPKPILDADAAYDEAYADDAARVAVGTEIVPDEWIEEPIEDDADVCNDSYEDDDEDGIIDIVPNDVEPAARKVAEDFEIVVTENEIVTDAPAPTDEELELEIEKPLDVEESAQMSAVSGVEKYDPTLDLSHYEFPTFDLLKTYPNENMPIVDDEEQNANKEKIKTTLRNYGIEIETIKATVGPTITLYEIVPKAGVRISKIRNLESDIMLSLAATGIRIIAPIPGKGTIGIEVPNEKPQIVSMHSVIASRKFQEMAKFELPVALGRTITNEIFMFDLAKTPHLLVAGATGQGKSVGLNAIITSLLYKKHPSQLKFVLVDPKMVEFNIYASLEKHYMAMMPGEDDVIITDSTKVIQTLNSLVIEMEDRYKLLMEARCRNIVEYNEKFINRQLNPEKGHRYLPYIVIVIDEFGDLIMVAGKEVEMPIARITQKARAVGMHMILATQRPSVNIITGVIKANVPARVAFRVQSMIDSRTILDAPGANQLVGKGDLLYSGGSDLVRVQCAFVDTPEVEAVVNHVSSQQAYPCAYELPEYVAADGDGGVAAGAVDLSKRDALFTDVARFVVSQQQGSTSVIQRKFQIGYNRAGRITDQLEAAGIVSSNNGSKGRQVLVQDDFTLTQILEGLLN